MGAAGSNLGVLCRFTGGAPFPRHEARRQQDGSTHRGHLRLVQSSLAFNVFCEMQALEWDFISALPLPVSTV